MPPYPPRKIPGVIVNGHSLIIDSRLYRNGIEKSHSMRMCHPCLISKKHLQLIFLMAKSNSISSRITENYAFLQIICNLTAADITMIL